MQSRLEMVHEHNNFRCGDARFPPLLFPFPRLKEIKEAACRPKVRGWGPSRWESVSETGGLEMDKFVRFGHCYGYRSPSHTLSRKIGKEFEGLFLVDMKDISKIGHFLGRSHPFNIQLSSFGWLSVLSSNSQFLPQLKTYQRSKKEPVVTTCWSCTSSYSSSSSKEYRGE